MKTLIINFENERDLKLVRELVTRLNAEIETVSSIDHRKKLPKSKFKTKEDFLSIGGIVKGQLISKENLRGRAWKKRA